jgi:polysaccharide biosynthesis protein PslG
VTLVGAALVWIALGVATGISPAAASTGVSADVELVPDCVSAFSSESTAPAVVGESFSFEVATCETSASPALRLRASNLPGGLRLHNHHDGTATITGRPLGGDVGQHVVLLSASLGGVVQAQQSLVIAVDNSTDAATPTTPDPPATGQPVIGISLPALLGEPAATQEAWLANLESIGVTSIRTGADWADISYAGPGTYDWSQLDEEVSLIRAAGMTVDMVITGTPSWEAVPGVSGTDIGQPADPAAFGEFAAAVAQRYAPEGVQDYEIWNEPNNTVFWQPAPNPAAYVQVLQASYTDIKAVDPSALVITGGLAPESNANGDINEVTFLQDMYADGAEGYFDALGDHPYSYPALPDIDEPWSGWSQMDSTPTSLESVMAANGDADKPIWITEVGAPTGGPDSVGTAGQAEDLTQAIENAKESPWIGAVYLYTYEDSGGNPATDEDWFGLLNADGSQKPAWAAVAAAIAG